MLLHIKAVIASEGRVTALSSKSEFSQAELDQSLLAEDRDLHMLVYPDSCSIISSVGNSDSYISFGLWTIPVSTSFERYTVN